MFSPDHFSGQPDHETWMRIALSEARQAVEEDEVPVGAVVVAAGRIVGSAHNQREQQAASSLGSWRLVDCVLYVTLEPCLMCAGAIVQARVPVVVWGAGDPKAGAVESLYKLFEDTRLNHQVEHVGHVLEQESSKLLSNFFRQKREKRRPK